MDPHPFRPGFGRVDGTYRVRHWFGVDLAYVCLFGLTVLALIVVAALQ